MKKLTKCENCGGNLVYKPSSGVVVCEHCDSSYPIPKTNRNIKILRKYTLDYVPESDQNVLNQYKCENCGSLLTVEEGKVSTRCPSCGATNVQKASQQVICPDGIIPFEIEKQKAVNIFEKWLKKRKFSPNDLISLAKNGKISSVYVPVYNINGTSACSYGGMVKKVHTDESSGTIFSTMHTVKDVSTTEIENVALCANSTVDTELLEEIVNIDQTKIVPYSSQYLFGYSGIETNISIHDALEKMKDQLEKSNEQKIRKKLKEKYDEIVHLNCNTSVRGVTFNYTYFPVFMNHYTYKNKNYHCYINGVNGKVAGKSPKSAGKILALLGGIILAIGALALVVLKIL